MVVHPYCRYYLDQWQSNDFWQSTRPFQSSRFRPRKRFPEPILFPLPQEAKQRLVFWTRRGKNDQPNSEQFEILFDGTIAGRSYQGYELRTGSDFLTKRSQCNNSLYGMHTITIQGEDFIGGGDTAFIDQVAIQPASSTTPEPNSPGLIDAPSVEAGGRRPRLRPEHPEFDQHRYQRWSGWLAAPFYVPQAVVTVV